MKSWGLWFIFIVHRARRILTWRGKDEFYTNHISVKEMWKARNTMTTGWEPSYSFCLPWHSSWNDVDLDTSSLLINRMVGFFFPSVLITTLLLCTDMTWPYTVIKTCPACRQPQIPWHKAPGACPLTVAVWRPAGQGAGLGQGTKDNHPLTAGKHSMSQEWKPAVELFLLCCQTAEPEFYFSKPEQIFACAACCFHTCSHICLAQEMFSTALDS